MEFLVPGQVDFGGIEEHLGYWYLDIVIGVVEGSHGVEWDNHWKLKGSYKGKYVDILHHDLVIYDIMFEFQLDLNRRCCNLDE